MAFNVDFNSSSPDPL